MSFRFSTWLAKYSAFALIFLLCSGIACAQPKAYSLNEEDTILIEKQVSQKIPYHRILKSFSRKFLQVNVDSLLTIGKTRRDAIARNFIDYADRVKYRLNVDKDELEVKLSLNF